ncbi:MAG: hypothetical protein J6386_22830 [Candidatus Synoicihabitans palmerolidicus]|nr:hypothetical protein [Candidatus Synoicihabitans palmerolidicus]
MDPASFKALTDPMEVDGALLALWHDARGDSNRAHEEVQRAASSAGDWMHAYLHRKEGDAGNAGYWYVRAGQSRLGSEVSLEAEWDAIATEAIGGGEMSPPRGDCFRLSASNAIGGLKRERR